MLGTSTVAQAASLAVSRVSGTDRYETAVAISKTAWPAGTDVAFVATGLNFADSVAVTAAGGDFGPVLLTRPNALPESTKAELKRLAPTIVFVLGGPNAVSDAVQLEILRTLPGTDVAVRRLAGTNRYETSVAISQELRNDATVVYLADGNDYAAGILAAASAGIDGGVLLTTRRDALHSSVANELARIKPTRLVAVGNLTKSVVDAASAFAGETIRIQGTSTLDLSRRMSEFTWASTEGLIVASAADFPDALAAAAWAVHEFVPLLLTNPVALDASTACEILRLGADNAVITGGPNAVSTQVATAITDIKPREYGCEDPLVITIPDPDPRTEEVEVTLYEMTTSPDAKRAYVVNNAWNSIEVIDVINGIWLGRINVGSNPVDIDLSPDGKTLYVVNNGSQTISVIDTTKPFNQAEIAQVDMLDAGPNPSRTFSIEVSSNKSAYIIPAVLENADATACLQQLDGLTMSYVEPGTDVNVPFGALQAFASADNELLGFIAPERVPDDMGNAPDIVVTYELDENNEEDVSRPISCKLNEADAAPAGTPTDEPTEEPTGTPEDDVAQAPLFLFTLDGDDTWTSVGAWGRPVGEVAYGDVDQFGVTSDGAGTATVFEAVGGFIVRGTVTSTAEVSYGLAMEPLQPNCPKDRGVPAQCTQLAYNVIGGEAGSAYVDVLDITVGRNVNGSFRVIDRIPLKSPVVGYGGKNQPTDAAILNQAVVTADAASLVIATEFSVEIIPIG